MKLAQRAHAEMNQIRKMFSLANAINKEKLARGEEPVLSLGIGAPHMYVRTI